MTASRRLSSTRPRGYDGALNTTVNNAGGMTIGSTIGVLGAAGTALATSSDGATVDSSGTYYTFGGGRALGLTRLRLG